MFAPSLRRVFSSAVLLAAVHCAVASIDGQTAPLAIGLAQREPVRIFFHTVYEASAAVPSAWTGNVSQGIAGTTSQAFQNAVALRINYFRAMAGVPAAITLSAADSAGDQQLALMLSANGAISHAPPASWADYTAAGALAAASSNVYLGLDGPAAITGYIQDPGANNSDAGHRRWLLYPQTLTMGTGDVDADPSGVFAAANALWVLDGLYGTPRPATRDNFVAWPPPGYVPYPLVFDRWSFSYPGADFSQAAVSMQQGGGALPVRLEPLAPAEGENTLVWVPNHLDPAGAGTAPAPAPAQDVTTAVTVSNVLINGSPQTFTYNVTVFDPAAPGPDTVCASVGGPAALATGSSAVYTFNPVPGATGYQWQAAAANPLVLLDNAENGPGDVTVNPAGVNVVTTAEAANGTASYQLTANPPTAIALNPVIVPAAGSTLQFNDLLGYATSAELGQVQLSADGGVTWHNLFARPGSGGPPETAFKAESVPLDAYAGLPCTIRFTYSATGTYYGMSPLTGWFIDDITVTGAQQIAGMSPPVPLAAGADSLTFAPSAAGTYALQVVPVFYGQYPDVNLAGPLAFVTVSAPSSPAISIISALAAGGQAGVAFSYQITATATPATFGAGGLPAGLAVDAATGIISGAPAAAGVFPVALSATGALGSAVATLILTVLPAPPVIVAGQAAAGQVGAPFSYRMAASNAPSAFAASGLPPGLRVNAGTGMIVGTPTAAGTYTVALSAQNAGGTATAPMVLTIAALPVVTIAASQPAALAGGGVPGILTITRTGGDASTDLAVSYTIKGTAVSGVDYVALSGTRKIKAGQTSAQVRIVPLAGAGAVKASVKVTLAPSAHYALGGPGMAKVTILP